MEPFWYDDVSVLIETSKLKKYIPLKSYSKDEKLNASKIGVLCINTFYYINI